MPNMSLDYMCTLICCVCVCDFPFLPNKMHHYTTMSYYFRVIDWFLFWQLLMAFSLDPEAMPVFPRPVALCTYEK